MVGRHSRHLGVSGVDSWLAEPKPPRRTSTLAASGGTMGGGRHRAEPVTAAAVALLVLLGLAAVFAPLLAPYDPTRIELTHATLPPSTQHLLGTDTLGRDLLSRVLYGARISLAVAVAAAALSALLGVCLGVTAAYCGRLVDAVVARLVDAAIAMPALFLLIALQSLFGSTVLNVIVVVSLIGWMVVARVVRAVTLSIKEREFVLAARSLGCSTSRIVFRHIFPNLAGQLVTLFALGVADALLLESALSFLGMGVPPTEPSWGNILNDAQAAILSGGWWIAVFPGALILGTAFAINLVGDGLQELLRPN